MPISYDYDPEVNEVYSRAKEVLTVPECVDHVNALLSDPRIGPGFIEVVDLSAASDFAMTYSQMSIFAEIYDRFVKRGVSRIIMFAPTDLAFGIFRMMFGVIQARASEDPTRFVVVRTEEERDRARATPRD